MSGWDCGNIPLFVVVLKLCSFPGSAFLGNGVGVSSLAWLNLHDAAHSKDVPTKALVANHGGRGGTPTCPIVQTKAEVPHKQCLSLIPALK